MSSFLQEPEVILVVDSDKQAAMSSAELVLRLGFKVEVETRPRNAFETIRRLEREIEVVLFDVVESYRDSFEILSRLKFCYPSLSLVASSLSTEFATAFHALSCGATEFISKPVEKEALSLAIEKARQRSPQQALKGTGLPTIAGTSDSFLDALRRIQAYSRSELPILLLGSAGVGKSLMAFAAHRLSARAEKEPLLFDLDQVPEDLRGAELFGIGERSSASWSLAGRLGEASDRTLVLENVQLMSLEQQQNFARYLRSGSYLDVHGRSALRSQARIIATADETLHSLLEKKRFSGELLTFFSAQTIQLPALRDRLEDIPALALFFVEKFSAFYRKSNIKLSSAALELLEAYDFPGNVRELSSIIQSAVLLVDGSEIETRHVSVLVRGKARGKREELHEVKLRTVMKVLAESNGNQTVAARRLGIARGSLSRILRRLHANDKY